MLKKVALGVAAVGLCGSSTASAASLEDSLGKLAPEFRAHQACITRGLDHVRRVSALKKADRMKTSIFSRAVFDGPKLIAKGGAVRSAGHWYAISFSCDMTSNWMKATTFSFQLGPEIPEMNWERLGLWR